MKHSRRRIMFNLILLIVLIISIPAAFRLFEKKLVYFPDGEMICTPSDAGMPWEEVWLETDDGVTLNGWFVPAEQARGTVLFCHGNAGNISHRLTSIEIFHQLGLNTFIFDYRGYGLSEGSPDEEGTYADAQAAWDYLADLKGIPPDSIIIFGRSIGAAIASHAAADNDPGLLILESPFSSLRQLGSELYPWLPVKLLSGFDYSTVDFVTTADCPLIVIHSREDDIIPFEHGQHVYEAATQEKSFLEISGDHNSGFMVSGAVYSGGLDSLLSEYGI